MTNHGRTLRLEIVTPEATAYSEDVEMVTLPGSEGELGVYPNHVPLLTTLNPGELRVLKGGKETFLAIGEGFVEITGDVGFGSDRHGARSFGASTRPRPKPQSRGRKRR